jgi:ribosome biogenesis GTPase
MREEEGRHTTTASRAYALDFGGTLMDSPGVRDFAPAIDQLDERTLGFPEIERLAAACRFQDCRHMREPDCAVIAAVEEQSLLPRRYESYRRLRRRYADLVEARGPGSRHRR